MHRQTGLNYLTATQNYIKCFEEEVSTCDVPILKHFIACMQAYGKHLEDKNEVWRKMVKGILVPP